MLEVLHPNGRMIRCVYYMKNGQLVQYEKYCKDKMLRNRVRQIGDREDWCGFEIKLSDLGGRAGININ